MKSWARVTFRTLVESLSFSFHFFLLLAALVRRKKFNTRFARMSDLLSDLPEGNSSDDPSMQEFFGEKKETKRSWRDYLKILGIAIVSFALSANPLTSLFLAKASFFQGAYKNFAGQTLLFFILFGLMLWYF